MKPFYFAKLIIPIVLFLGWSSRATAQTYSIPGGPYNYTVPAGVTQIGIDMAGAQGDNSAIGGKGGRVQCNLQVSPGQILYVYVGGAGSGSTGGANGGGSGGSHGGGGGSDIRTSASGTAYTNRLVVAGGGGGGATWCYSGSGVVGGYGGYPSGSNGGDNCYGTYWGYGASYTSAGAGAVNASGGSLGVGGAAYCCEAGGSGGGGYYGGGGGFVNPGGGGSSYAPGAVGNATSNIVYTNGTQSGPGYVTIFGPTLTATPASVNFGAVTSGTTSVPPVYFVMNGSYMGASPLTITAPANVELWNPGTSSWTAPGGNIAFAYAGNTITNAGVYLKFVAPALPGSYCGNITITGGGLSSTVNVNACGTSAASCSGSIPPGSSIATPAVGGVATQFVLSLVGAPLSGGLTYQWQSSTGGPFTNIPGAVLPTYSFTGVSVNTTYQCVVTCPASGSSAVYGGAAITYQGLTASSCTPSCYQVAGNLCAYGAVGSTPYPFKVFGITTLTDATACGLNKYTDQTSSGITCTMAPGQTYNATIGSNTSAYTQSYQVWIDFNNNGVFDPTESVGGVGNINAGNQVSIQLAIPGTAVPGQYRMRVQGDFSNGFAPGANANYPCYPQQNPCPDGTASQTYYADTRDYKITIGNGPCSGTPNPGVADATQLVGCNGFTTNLFDVIAGAPSGLTYQWMQSPTLGSGYFNSTGSSAAPAYTATVTAVGVTYYVCQVTCPGGGTALTNPIAVTVNPPPAPISGAGTVCNGSSVPLASSPGGGVWTSGNTAIATVGSSTGNVTGAAVGSTNITYTLPSTGCFATTTVGVLNAPGPITGLLQVCAGGTTSLSDPVSGGNWTSGTPSLLSVGSSTGLVTSVIVGSTSTGNIIYTLPDLCSTIATVTVNPNPTFFSESVVGSAAYCAGSSSTADIRLSASQSGFSYQLQLGGIGISTLTGTGGPLDFGVQTATGVYKIVGTNPATGCINTMAGSVTVTINPVPVAYPLSVSGGGTYCAGSPLTAPHVILGGSQTGVSYQLYLSGVPIGGAVPGTGTPIDFGAQTAGGSYTVIASTSSVPVCTSTMTGSAIVIVNPAPTAFTVTGGGPFCAGSAGVDIGLSFSNTGISYQLMNGAVSAGPAVMGTGAPLDFGIQTIPGTYSVVATNISTFCMNNMSGTPTVSVNTPPNAYAVGGGGSYCAGGTGVSVCLPSTDAGVNYQLYIGGLPVGAPLAGTGLPLCFPNETTAGVYTIVATNPATTCTANMTGSASVAINPLPTVYNMTGGGNYCSGGIGVNVGLSGSNAGISYQLFNTASPGATLSGTGGVLTYGLQTVPGTYTVVATNTTTHCVSNMAGAATVGINPLPTQHNVLGTGAYCAGGTGVDVSLDFSDPGVKYQLYIGGSTPVGGTVAGTGALLDFGNMTTAGTYTVGGTNIATGCADNMNGSAVITINPLPANHLVTGGGSYCAGGSGVDVGLNGSNTGFTYQLFLGASPFGSSMAGTGSTLDFGFQVLPGTYTVQATDNSTGCFKNMVGGATVNINANPTPFNVTGGGVFCAGGSGVHVGLSGSTIGIKYQMWVGGVAVGSAFSGTGSALDFGAQVTTGTYTVVATNPSTGCINTMTGSATVATNPAPPVYAVTGGGAYCAGTGGVDVGLAGSDFGINYQLMMGGSSVGTLVSGTGGALDFGNQTAAGTYTVVATDGTTGCSDHMAANAIVAINALPTVYTLTGGGAYCAGGAGFHIVLNLSTPGISYQLYNGAAPDGPAMMGTGAAVDFGLKTAAGTYSVIATNPSTTCTNNMAGSASISINPLPATHNVTGGGSYCPGGAGATIGLDGSDAGIKYQLMYGISGVGAAVSGTGSAITFGMHSPTGSYTVVGTNTTTGCVSNMTGSASVNVATPPAIYSVTGGGTYCAGGIGLNIGLSNSDNNVNYQLYNGSTPSGIALPGTGGAIDFGRKVGTGTYSAVATDVITGCTSNMSGTAMISIAPVVLPHVTVTPSIIGTVCVGQTISFSASPVNGGTAPTYQWMVNGINAGVGSTYTYIPLNGDVVTATIHSNQICAIPDTGSTSMTVSVSPMEMPSATVAVNPGTLVCTGTAATFTATTMFGGLAPSLTWVKNGVAVATGTSYTYTPSNGDIVTFMLGSNFNCRLADTVFSAPSTMDVQDPVIPTVAVTSSAGVNINAGQPVTFKAVVTHGGPALHYQWVVNSSVIPGANGSTYTTSSLNDRDSVTCEVTGVCGLVGFNEIVVRVSRVGVAQVTAAGSDVRLIPNPNRGEFTVKGTLATTDDQEAVIEVTDMIGQVVYSGKAMIHNGVIDEHVKLNGTLANGMYLLNLRAGTENNVFHFVVEQ